MSVKDSNNLIIVVVNVGGTMLAYKRTVTGFFFFQFQMDKNVQCQMPPF